MRLISIAKYVLKSLCIGFREKKLDILRKHLVYIYSFNAIPRLHWEQGRVSHFNQSINWHQQIKDHVEGSHLTKFDACRVNRHQIIDVEIGFKFYTNVSNFETVSSKTI